MSKQSASPTISARSVSGVQLAQGVGVQEAKGFWADAWSQVLKRRAAVAALSWLSIVAFLAVFGPWLANGHPIILRELDSSGSVVKSSSPLIEQMKPSDIVLPIGAVAGVAWLLLTGPRGRSGRLWGLIFAGFLTGVIVIASSIVQGVMANRDPPPWAQWLKSLPRAGVWVPMAIAIATFGIGMALPAIRPIRRRLVVSAAACILSGAAVSTQWDRPLDVFDYHRREAAGQVRATYTVIPWSPSQRFTELDRQPPMTTLGEGLQLNPGTPGAGRTFIMGTDALGQDVLANIIWACRLSISIGLVSTGIATLIGVTMGALMGYFGGWVDLVLFRIVEIFMAVPVLFLLIVAAAVLPPEMRSTYVMMAIIGCFTWTGAARYTRAEFMKLRNQDFVQSAKAVGLPLRSVLFKHMLPNGVTPVLVDASFSIAAAITIEATLSFLGLGPIDQASWGKLLASAMSAEALFKWWLAVFPGAVIFLTVLSYNLMGESLRDAIDPKLKKARV